MKYIFFIDIDGTLIYRGKIHERVYTAVKKARERGHLVFINTGRAYNNIPKKEFDELGIDGVVCALGSFIRVGDNTLYSVTASDEAIRVAFDLAERTGRGLVVEGENNIAVYNFPPKTRSERYVSSYDDLYAVMPDIRVSKFTFVPTFTDAESKELGRYLTIYNHPTYTETANHGHTKASAMEQVAKMYGLTIENTVAIGDSGNDREMLLAAGISVAMGNASDEIKSICDIITLDAKDGGVGYAIEKIISE